MNPTTVTGYSYEPGLDLFGDGFNRLSFQNAGKIQEDPYDKFENKDTLSQIVKLFRWLESDERKYCLDLLDSIDTDMDTETLEENRRQSSNGSDVDLFEFEDLEDGNLGLKYYIGYSDAEIIIPQCMNGKKVTKILSRAFEKCT